MRRICTAALSAAALLILAPGCQTMPPRPLELNAVAPSALDVAPVAAYVQALDALADAEGDAPFNADDGLSLREGQAVALWYNPAPRIARLRAEQAKAVASSTGRWADPEIGLEPGQKAVDGEADGFLGDAGSVTRSWINAGTLSITIPISGRLRAEKKLRQSEHDVALLRATEAEWQTLRDVRDAWARWSASKERIRLLDEHLALLGQFSDSASALAGVGEVAPSGARLFAIETMRKQAERTRETFTEVEQRAALLQLLGLAPEAPVTLLPTLASASPTHGVGETPDLLAHPTIARVRAEYQRAEDHLRVELRKQYPDLVISPTYTDEQDETAITLGLGLPIPVWNANRQGIAEAAGARDLARAQAEAEYLRLRSEVAQAHAAQAGSQAQRAQLLEGVVPAVDAQMHEALSLLAVGELDLILLYEALVQAFEAKQELLNTTLAEALAASRLAAATTEGALAPNTPTETQE